MPFPPRCLLLRIVTPLVFSACAGEGELLAKTGEVQPRLAAVRALAEPLRNLHRDDATDTGYSTVSDILASFPSSATGPHGEHSDLARIYYAGAHLFLTASYVPAVFQSSRTPVEDWILVDSSSPPPGIDVGSSVGVFRFPGPLLDYARKLEELEALLDRYNATSRPGTPEAFFALSRLQAAQVDALVFHEKLLGIAPPNLIEEWEGEWNASDFLEQIIAAPSPSPYGKYLALSLRLDRVFFKALISLYYGACSSGGSKPDVDRAMRLGEAMDTLLDAPAADTPDFLEAAERDLRHSAEALEAMAELAATALMELPHSTSPGHESPSANRSEGG